jgi:GxxExxY protein
MEPQSTPNTQIGAGRDRLDALSKQIIGCALTVMRTSGAGFLQKVYENALVHELRSAGIGSRNNTAWSFDTTMPGSGTTPWDLLVENIVLEEWKVARAIDDVHRAQS